MAKLTPTQIKLFEELHNSRSEDFKTFNKKSYRGVWSSIIDKYPESAHFVYELLQNADDAEATEVYIILQRDKMLFKHNGTKHFDITREDAKTVGDINSITGIGDSSKVDTQNKIDLLLKYLDTLSKREKEIIIKRYGLNNQDEMTQKEIAKELGISRSYVSRIEKRSLTKMLREFIKEYKEQKTK